MCNVFGLFHSVNIMYYYYQLLFLFLVSGYAIDDVARFLHDQGLDHLSLFVNINVCDNYIFPQMFWQSQALVLPCDYQVE